MKRSLVSSLVLCLALGMMAGLLFLLSLSTGQIPTAIAAGIDGQARPAGAGYDLGADELQNMIRYVAPDGADSGDCSSPAGRCRTVQYAVDQAWAGDEVRVAAGVYTGVNIRPSPLDFPPLTITQTVFISKDLSLLGGYTTGNWLVSDPAANPTVLDPGGQGRGVVLSGEISATVEGFHITNGYADVGGGLLAFNTQPQIAHNRIISNTATQGGGMCLYDCTQASVHHNLISNNSSGYGPAGILVARSEASLIANTIVSNTSIMNPGSEGQGGGVVIGDSQVTMQANLVVNNLARTGGGMLVFDSQVTMTNNLIATNRIEAVEAYDLGSGLYVCQDSNLTLLHNTIVHNTGGDGSGISVRRHAGDDHSELVLSNTLIVSHTVGLSVQAGSTATLQATLWGNEIDWSGEGTIVTGTINLWGPPDFVDPAAGDYHLGPQSAAIDAGIDAGVTTDIDGEPRPMGQGYEIGADEFDLSTWFNRKVYLPIISK